MSTAVFQIRRFHFKEKTDIETLIKAHKFIKSYYCLSNLLRTCGDDGGCVDGTSCVCVCSRVGQRCLGAVECVAAALLLHCTSVKGLRGS